MATSQSTTLAFLPLTASLVSKDEEGNELRFILSNSSSQTLTLTWIDSSGKETVQGTLAPGKSFGQSSYDSHAWKVSSSDATIGFKFMASLPGHIVVSDTGLPSFADHSELVSHTVWGDWSSAQGFGLINVAKSLNIPDFGATLPMNGQNNHLALNMISASSAWAAGITGNGVKVAVLDMGVASHAEIAANHVGGYDLVDGDSDTTPDAGANRGHGLAVTAVIGASHEARDGRDIKGVAPGVQLIDVRVGSASGSDADKLALGIRKAVELDARVIVIPLGNAYETISPSVVDAIDHAYAHDVVVVISGGNASNFGATGPALAALSAKAIDVGNFDAAAGQVFASSNQPGDEPFPWVMASSTGYFPHPDGGYGYVHNGGTSYAAPYVAGLAALLLEQSPEASAKTVISRIIGAAPAFQAFGPAFITTVEWDPVNDVYGATIAIVGTLATSFIALAIAFPVSFGIALFLTEICPVWLRRPMGTAVELLAGIPSIIYGMWGLFVFAPMFADHVQPFLKSVFGPVPWIGQLFTGPIMGIGILTAGIILAVMIIPFISSVMRDVFEIVPAVLKESAYGLGCTKWEVVRKIVLPYTKTGVVGGVMLGLGRALGETMAVTFVIGNANELSKSLFSAGNSISSTLANEFAEAQSTLHTSSLFALALILFAITFIVLSAAKVMLAGMSRKEGVK